MFTILFLNACFCRLYLICGRRRMVVVGRVLRVHFPISSCKGLALSPCLNVLWHSSSTGCGSLPSIITCCSIFFAVFTAVSDMQLDCAWSGLDSMCSKPHSLVNFTSSLLKNWGPLSLRRADGRPCLAKFALVFLMTAADVVDRSWSTSKNPL